jgi:hypothetical protein
LLAGRDEIEQEVHSCFPDAIEARMSPETIASDLELYTRQCLNEKMSAGELPIGPKAFNQICKVLNEKSQGMLVSLLLSNTELTIEPCIGLLIPTGVM